MFPLVFRRMFVDCGSWVPLLSVNMSIQKPLKGGCQPPLSAPPHGSHGRLQFLQHRHLHVHEHVGFSLMKQHGVPIPNFSVARTPDEALQVAENLRKQDQQCRFVVKAQVLAGGRGKGTFKNGLQGGVQLVDTPESVRDIAAKMLGQTLVTRQSGEKGLPCNAVAVFERMENIRQESYFALALDREKSTPVVIASPMGGMNVEELSRDHPDKLHIIPLDIHRDMSVETAVEVTHKLLGKDDLIRQVSMEDARACFKNLYSMFRHYDMTLLEVNPLVMDGSGRLICVDCKSNFDESAEFRQKEVFAQRDLSQENSTEVEARSQGLAYVGFDGNIGCVVNGAGLAMAVMDMIHLSGGNPANFLDVGGGVTPKQMREALRIVLSNPAVETILVYIFGGINRCDLVAEGLINTMKEFKLKIPVVVRLQGTKSEEGRRMIQDSGLKLYSAHGFRNTVELAVQLAGGKAAAA